MNIHTLFFKLLLVVGILFSAVYLADPSIASNVLFHFGISLRSYEGVRLFSALSLFIFVFIFLISVLSNRKDGTIGEKLEYEAKLNIYNIFFDSIKKYYRVITKFNTILIPNYEVENAAKLKYFYDVAMSVGGEKAQAAQAENLKNMEDAGGNFLEGQAYGFFFQLYPFTEIPLELILSLPLSTLTAFILGTARRGF